VELEAAAGAPALVARRVLCGIAFQAGDIAAALRRTRDLVDRARAAGDEPLACEAEGHLAQLHDAAGDASTAIALALEMRARADLLRAPFLASWSRYVSGVVSLRRDPATARDWFTQSLACARATTQHHMIRFNLRALGVAALLDGDPPEAARRLRAALDHNDGRSNATSQWATVLAVAPLLAADGRDAAAVALLAAADAAPAAALLGSLAILGPLAADTREEAARRLGSEARTAAVARGRGLEVGAAVALARAELVAAYGDLGEPAVSQP
jgi:hypothetical protein